MHVFTYGTLMIPSVMEAVTGRRFAAQEALLYDYARFRLEGATYPGLIPQKRAKTDGVLYLDVDAPSIARLDAFEGDIIEVEWPLDRFTDRELHEKSVLVALAGPVAEMIHSGEPYHPGLVAEWAADWKMAWKAAAPLFPAERERLAYLEQSSVQLYRLLDRKNHWAALAAIVDNLLAHETLEAEEVEDIVSQWLR